VVKYCDYLDYSDEPDYDALIDGLVKNMDDWVDCWFYYIILICTSLYTHLNA
jgi:hypothetical protein